MEDQKEVARQQGENAITLALSKIQPTRDAGKAVVKRFGDPTYRNDDTGQDVKVVAYTNAALDKVNDVLVSANTKTVEGIAVALNLVVGPPVAAYEHKLGRAMDFVAAVGSPVDPDKDRGLSTSEELKAFRDLLNGDNPRIGGVYQPLWDAYLATRGYLPVGETGIIAGDTEVGTDMSGS